MKSTNEKIAIENDELFLREPCTADAKMVMEFKEEFADFNSDSAGDSNLKGFDKFSDWLDEVENGRNWETVPAGRVPQRQFLTFRQSDGKLVGMINLRLELNDYLLKFGGHIGDCVRPTERGKGYATKQISLVLKIAKEFGLERVLITCKKSNPASAKSIIKNGGVLENEVENDGEIMQRYWIQL